MNEGQSVALGDEPADLVVAGGRVYSSNRRTFLDRSVAVVDDRIAALPADAERAIGPETTVVSAADRYVLPGFVDAHTHEDIHVTIEQRVPHLLAAGTTAVVTEASGLGTPFGARGVDTLLEATASLSVSVRVAVPPQPLVDTFEPVRAGDDDADALADLLERDRVVGVGEIDWIHVVGRDSPVDGLHDRAREAGKRVVGHGAGCRGDSLAAFATVVDDDHEAIDAEGVVERAEQGIHVVGRCGSIRDDLAALVGALDRVDPGRVSLSTDGVWPPDLREGFGMAEVVRRTIDAGVDPIDAIGMATRNPADHFGLDDRGRIEPGAAADLVIVEDLESMGVESVIANGDVVVSDGDPIDPPAVDYPEYVYDSVSVETGAERFTAPADASSDGRVRAMAVGEGLVTRPTTVTPTRDGDRLHADPDEDVVTATLLDRSPGDRDGSGGRGGGSGNGTQSQDGDGFTGFLEGFGLEAGAVATTNTWEVPALAVVAADAGDAAVAADRVAAQGGGWALVRDGEVVADLPMPVGAAAAQECVDTVADGFERLETELRRLGASVDRPLVTVQTLSFVGVPALKLSPSGYADVLDRTLVGLDP